MIKSFLNANVKTRPALLALFLCVPLFFMSACSDDNTLQSYHFSGPTMGTQYNITIALEEGQVLPFEVNALQQDVDLWLLEFNQIMSTYIPDSELMRFNGAEVGHPVSLSEPLFEVFELSEKIYKASDGSFDTSVGPLVNLWGFGPGASINRRPQQGLIDEQLAKIGQNKLVLNQSNRTATKDSELFIDLSAVAKGYGADIIARKFDAVGVANYLIEVGGEIRVKGQSSLRRPWRLGVEQPSLLHTGNTRQTVSVSSGGIATSGDYRNYFEHDGVRYSHTIDPRTGAPVTHKLVSVTVIAASAAEADAWATALSVIGPEQALSVADKNNLAVYLIVKSADGFTESHNSLFAPYIGVGD